MVARPQTIVWATCKRERKLKLAKAVIQLGRGMTEEMRQRRQREQLALDPRSKRGKSNGCTSIHGESETEYRGWRRNWGKRVSKVVVGMDGVRSLFIQP
jgi:hypothetical protein